MLKEIDRRENVKVYAKHLFGAAVNPFIAETKRETAQNTIKALERTAEQIPFGPGDFMKGARYIHDSRKNRKKAASILKKFDTVNAKQTADAINKREKQIYKLNQKITQGKFSKKLSKDKAVYKKEQLAFELTKLQAGLTKSQETTSLTEEEQSKLGKIILQVAEREAALHEFLQKPVPDNFDDRNTRSLEIDRQYHELSEAYTELNLLTQKTISSESLEPLKERNKLIKEAQRKETKAFELLSISSADMTRKGISWAGSVMAIAGVGGALANLSVVGGALTAAFGTVTAGIELFRVGKASKKMHQLQEVKKEYKEDQKLAEQYKHDASVLERLILRSPPGDEQKKLIKQHSDVQRNFLLYQERASVGKRFYELEKRKQRDKIIVHSLGAASRTSLAAAGASTVASLIPGAAVATGPLALSFAGAAIGFAAIEIGYEFYSERKNSSKESKLNKKNAQDSQIGVSVRVAALIQKGESPKAIQNYLNLSYTNELRDQIETNINNKRQKAKYKNLVQWADNILSEAAFDPDKLNPISPAA